MRVDRDAFRPHALDGAMLYFQPSTGWSLRIDGPATTGLTRRAPRVALFGLSHDCNLRCSFCSRDASIDELRRAAESFGAELWLSIEAADALQRAFDRVSQDLHVID